MSRRLEAAARARHIQIIQFRDCAYFETDHWALVDGFPLIVAHEICTKWGDGCKTSPDGFCFLADEKTAEDREGQT